MKFFRRFLDKQGRVFEKGGKLERLYPFWEAVDTFLYTPGKVTGTAPHVRDGIDLKRIMVIVIIALIPCAVMAMYDTGLQANLAIEKGGHAIGWRGGLIESLGLGFSAKNILACFAHGALYYLPVVAVTFIVGGTWEVLFAIARKHEVNEGFLVTGMLFPLIVPPTVPLWQVALGISFGVVIGKEIFGGTGMNIWNPALLSRAFLFFAYPAEITKDQVWIAVDGYSSATSLSRLADGGTAFLHGSVGWWNAFLGFEAGSMGETSALACLLGAVLLIVTGVGSWRIMAGVAAGTIVMATTFNLIGSETNAAFGVPFWWHMVLGGWALGTVFMATDPVSAPYTNQARYIYGCLIGCMILMIRVLNPAFPEGVMLAILFMNTFSAILDHFVVQANIKRRMARYAA